MIKIFQSVYPPILFFPTCSIICLNSKCFLVLVAQSCQTLCNPMDCSPPGSSVHWILQARIVEQVAILFSRGSSWPRDQTQISHTAGRVFTIWANREAHKSTPFENICSPYEVRKVIQEGLLAFWVTACRRPWTWACHDKGLDGKVTEVRCVYNTGWRG